MFKKKPVKRLTFGKLKVSGKNNSGRSVFYYRGGACKRRYRLINFKNYFINLYGIVLRIEYDPNRSSSLLLISYSNGISSYSLNILGVYIGFIIYLQHKKPFINVGETFCIDRFKKGSSLHNPEIFRLRGAQYVRSSGNKFKTITPKNLFKSLIKLNSKKLLLVSNKNIATKGRILSRKASEGYKKASYSRYKGWKPHVRGVAMNPIDHPHGGGQGKTSGGRPSSNPWGLYTKGIKTRNKIKSGLIL